jgi:hypothetical protein
MSIQAEGQYYAGTIKADGEFLPAGSFDKRNSVPLDGEHLVIDVMNTGIGWSLHGVSGHKSSACMGFARIKWRGDGERVLVLDAATCSGASNLFPDSGVLNGGWAKAFLANLMKGLPDWPTTVVLPLELLPPGEWGSPAFDESFEAAFEEGLMTPERHIAWLQAEAEKSGRPVAAIARSILNTCYSVPAGSGFPAAMAKDLPGLLPFPGGDNPERVTYRAITEISIEELVTAFEFIQRLAALQVEHVIAMQDVLDERMLISAQRTDKAH